MWSLQSGNQANYMVRKTPRVTDNTLKLDLELYSIASVHFIGQHKSKAGPYSLWWERTTQEWKFWDMWPILSHLRRLPFTFSKVILLKDKSYPVSLFSMLQKFSMTLKIDFNVLHMVYLILHNLAPGYLSSVVYCHFLEMPNTSVPVF